MKVWVRILKVLNKCGRFIKLDQSWFIDLRPFSRDPEFNMDIQTFKHDVNSLFDWLAEKLSK